MEDIFKKGERAALFTALGTVVFAGLKAVAGFLTGSVVLLADALHGASDSVTTFLAWLGLKVAKRKPTERFPYGFYKAENISALVISLFIFFAGFEILRISWERLFSPVELTFSLLAVLIPFFDGITMFFLGKRELKVGRQINSQSLIADGREAKSHIYLSGVVLLGLLFSFLKVPYVEALAAVFISFFIFREGFESFKDTLFSLLDVSPGGETEQKIRWILQNMSGLRGFERLKLRRSGPFVFGQVTAEVAGSTDVKRAREISESVEKRVKKEIPSVDSFTVALKPFKGEERVVVVPVDEDRGLDSTISPRFGRAELFLFGGVTKEGVEEAYVKKNPYKEKEVRAGLAAVEFVTDEKIDTLITREIGPIALHTLRDDLVEVFKAKEGTVKEVFSKLMEGELEEIQEPTKEKT